MVVSGIRARGPLAGRVEDVRGHLLAAGYSPRTAQGHAFVVAHLSRWLEQEQLAPSGLAPEELERFVECRRREGYRRWLSVGSLRLVLDYLRGIGVVPLAAQPPRGPVDEVLEDYRRFLRVERGLAARTIVMHESVGRRFLSSLVAEGRLVMDGLDAAFVSAFVLAETRRCSTASLQASLSPLRMLLRFLFATARARKDLSGAVPRAAGLGRGGLPRAVDAATMAALLDSCDRTTGIGRRDYAVLMLLVRLGLRAGEVAALELADIDWRAGELVVHGKGARVDRLPLPADVGEAVAGYLRGGPARARCRAVFLRACGPEAGMSARAVVMVPRSASQRAGLSALVGAHRLRHTAATGMLRAGASLEQVGEVLRHRNPASTAIYATVDQAALRLLARPWPEPVR
jgi:integrase/recombinase XerD